MVLSAVNSFDPDGDALDFTWFFTTIPPLSQQTDDDIEADLPTGGASISLIVTLYER